MRLLLVLGVFCLADGARAAGPLIPYELDKAFRDAWEKVGARVVVLGAPSAPRLFLRKEGSMIDWGKLPPPPLPTWLEVTYSKLSEAAAKRIGTFDKVDALYFSYMEEIPDEAWRHLSGLKRLVYLTSNLTGMTDEGAKHLARLDLRALYLTEPRVTERGLAAVAAQKELIELSLWLDFRTEGGLRHLWGLKKLTFLGLRGELTDATLEPLQGLPNLQDMGIRSEALTDKAIPYLARLKSLRALRLYNTKLTAEGFKALRKALPRCKIESGNIG